MTKPAKMYKISQPKNTVRFTEKELLDNIQEVWDFLGRQPFCADMDVHPSKVTFGTYFNRFGSWKKSLQKFVEYKNGGVAVFEQNNEKLTKRRALNNSLRYDVMKRDNFKCVCCGKSPATTNKCELEVDHKIPVTLGGQNCIENLQTLCKDCNIGKFNKP